MSEYGLTPKGPNIKRLDVIVEEMHESLSKKWGVNTRQNPQSFVNHLVTNVADRLAELWEFGEDIYYSQYPSSAEGVSLDNAAQFGGTTRETGTKSYYPIHCKGIDGTKLAPGTMIASKTNPKTYLSITEEREITRASFNVAEIKVVSSVSGDRYSIGLGEAFYAYTATSSRPIDILKGLKDAITDEKFEFSVDETYETLTIRSKVLDSQNYLTLSENLTTETVTSVIVFGTTENGDILIPDGAITEIVKADVGLFEVINPCGYVAGRKEETDTEFRLSYSDKIFNRSSMMIESIRSAILSNVRGVISVVGYENATNSKDEEGRPPHSIEMVVDGGDETQIAQQILKSKAGGISTFGDTAIDIAGVFDEKITVRFNRPQIVNIWLKLDVTKKAGESLPPNYVELLKEAIMSNIGELDAGQDVVPQAFLSDLYKACAGISYIDISIATTSGTEGKPDEYPDRSIIIEPRQRAYITEDMIEVNI